MALLTCLTPGSLLGSSGEGQNGHGHAIACVELVAELGAVLLGDRLEIGSAMANHAAYLGDWVGLLKESPRMLLQVLGDARKGADLVFPEKVDAQEISDLGKSLT